MEPKYIQDYLFMTNYSSSMTKISTDERIWLERSQALSIILFANNYIDRKDAKIIYIGSFPDKHVLFLAKLFPEFHWHLYDEKTEIEEFPDNIEFHKFNIEDVKRFRQQNDCYLVCNVSHKPKLSYVYDEQTVIDMKNQEKIYGAMLPKKALLRFRLPRNRKTFKYLDGAVFFSPYTSETQIIVESMSWKNWGVKDYYEKLNYHNNYVKERLKFYNYHTEDSGDYEPIDEPELLNDYNSSTEIFILSQYLKSVAEQQTDKNIIALSKLLTKTIDTSIKQFRNK